MISYLATGGFIAKHELTLFLGQGGTGKSRLAQAIVQVYHHSGLPDFGICQAHYRVHYGEGHVLLDFLRMLTSAGTRKQFMTSLAAVPLLINDFGIFKLRLEVAEDLLQIITRRYKRASTANVQSSGGRWGQLPGYHGRTLKCRPRSSRSKTAKPSVEWAISQTTKRKATFTLEALLHPSLRYGQFALPKSPNFQKRILSSEPYGSLQPPLSWRFSFGRFTPVHIDKLMLR